MAIIFDQIEATIMHAPVSTTAEQQQPDKKQTMDPAEVRRSIEIMSERAARLDAE